MPTKRTPLNRERKALIDPETVRLFVELENMPTRSRRSERFEKGEAELHRRLGLYGDLFLSGRGASVLSRAKENPWRPPYAHRETWFRLRAVREQLLAAAGLGDQRQAKAS